MSEYFKRQKFITSFTHESLRKSVLWRLEHLKPAILSQQGLKSLQNINPPPLPASAIRFLDRSIRDALGRPIAILRVSQLDFKSGLENLKRDIVLSLEWMRVVLQQINALESKGTFMEPVLQYVVAVDVKDVSITTIVRCVPFRYRPNDISLAPARRTCLLVFEGSSTLV